MYRWRRRLPWAPYDKIFYTKLYKYHTNLYYIINLIQFLVVGNIIFIFVFATVIDFESAYFSFHHPHERLKRENIYYA